MEEKIYGITVYMDNELHKRFMKEVARRIMESGEMISKASLLREIVEIYLEGVGQ